MGIMTENMKSILIILLVAIVLSPNGLAQVDGADYEIVDDNDIPDVLSMLVTATQANFEKIKTWQGRIARETLSTTRGKDAARLLTKYTDAEPNDSLNEIQRFYNRTIEFKIDVENNRFFSFSGRSEPYIYVDTEKGKAYTSSWSPEESIFLVTSEYEIEIMPLNETKDHVVLNRLAIKEQAGATAITDPRKEFHTGGRLLWVSLSMLSENLKTPDIEHFGIIIKKKTSGEHIIYRIEISDPGKSIPFNIFILDSKAGFNRTYMENHYDENGWLMSEVTTEYINFNGVFLPKKWKVSQYFPDGGLMRQVINTIENQQINISIPESKFSVNTYLSDGDKLRDNIANKEYTYQNGKLVEAEKKSE
jgi:hypothetical protein